MENHICNTNNEYYKYAEKKGYPLIAVIPQNHCVFCGDIKNNITVAMTGNNDSD